MRIHKIFSLFGLQFQTWGTFFALAALVGFFLLIYLGAKRKKDSEILSNIFFLAFFIGIIGARAFYFLIHPQTFSWVEFLYFWQGGYILFGGAVFALLTIISYLIYKKDPTAEYSSLPGKHILDYLNLLTIPALSALILIRTGSLLILDNIGKITTAPWAIQFLGQMRHPIDTYYLILDFILLGLSIYLFKKNNPRLFFIILIGLAIGRLVIHFFATFINSWDAGLDLTFWSISFIVSLIGLSYSSKKSSS